MEIDTRDRKKTIFGMVEENTYITMAAIIWAIGSRVKCREQDSFLTVKTI